MKNEWQWYLVLLLVRAEKDLCAVLMPLAYEKIEEALAAHRAFHAPVTDKSTGYRNGI